MKTLHIIASPRGEMSKSKMLGQYLSQTLWGEVIELDVNAVEIPYLTFPVIANNYGFQKYEDLSDADKKIVDLQNQYIEQIKSADNIVVSAPLWNFGIPAALKGYIDLVSKVGVTFSMGANGYEGLVKNIKNFYIVTTKGGVYENTAWQDIEVLEKHLKQAFGFMGIAHTKTFNLEWANMKDKDALETEITNIKNDMKASV